MTSWVVGVPGVYGKPSVAVFIVAVTTGADLSMRIGPNVAPAAAPATFTAWPATVVVPSADTVTGVVHELRVEPGTPKSGSDAQVNVTVTFWLVGPPAYGPLGVDAAAVIVGVVMSVRR